jgi:hypothetical protein
MTSPFHVVYIGIALPKFTRIMAHLEPQGYQFSYIVTRFADAETLRAGGVPDEHVHLISLSDGLERPTRQEIADLAALEVGDVPTVHNMLRSDPVVSRLPYDEGIAYSAHLARGLRQLFRVLRPSVIIGGHDRVHSAMGMAIARAEGIPWYGLNFSTVPMGHITLSPSVVPAETLVLGDPPMDELRTRAAALIDEFEQGRLKAPAYVSAHRLGIVVRRLGDHVRAGVRTMASVMLARHDRFNDLPLGPKVRQYFRKRINMVRLPHRWFLSKPPAEPFLFFGLHMQPESTPDVLAPFSANQFDVVEKIARALPPTHLFLIKLHISDADNYSRAQLRAFLRLPRVRLVLPAVSSRDFIDEAAAVVTIAGTMGLEASLLGKPVIIFGKMNYETFSTVTRVTDMYELPALVRRQLTAPPPSREQIVDDYARYLSAYFSALTPGSDVRLDDWTHLYPSEEEKRGFGQMFNALRTALKQGGSAEAERVTIGPKSLMRSPPG